MNRIGRLTALLVILFLGACTNSIDNGQNNNSETPIDSHETQALQTDKQQVREGKKLPPAPHPLSASDAIQKSGGVVLAKSRTRVHGIMPIPANTNAAWNRESYDFRRENGFVPTSHKPLSTFSIDVDTASYANVRRFLRQAQLPPVGAVRIEEMINYFSYDYPQPAGNHPFSVTTELGPCPWNQEHQLVRIGLKARGLDKKELPPSNLVFLIDVSGSMQAANKLPLLQQAMRLLVRQLGRNDRVSIVVYAGRDRVILEPTPGSEQEKILAAIKNLGAGGATHASSGILTAYNLAQKVYMPKGNNRIILASDGDFNVGVTSRGELERLIAAKRKSGIYLTVLGFGMGNYHDDSMEILADRGNGNYAYIDSLLEAKKVLVKEMSGTMFTLARDVKIQVEFNPARVAAHRLIGYENRTLADEDFNDDKKDAGEIGAGHTVTALYELIPAGANDIPEVDALRYQRRTLTTTHPGEIMTVKLRYKPLFGDQSLLIKRIVKARKNTLAVTSNDFRFAAAVAGFGMLLTNSEYRNSMDYDTVISLARDAKGADREGYRAECIRLMETAQLLKGK